MTTSKAFGASRPVNPHLIDGPGGISREVWDLRKDIEVAFSNIEGRLTAIHYPEITFIDGGLPILNGGEMVIKGLYLLQGQEFAQIVLPGNVGLNLIACRPGTPGNAFSVEIVQGGAGLTVAMPANKLTITLAAGGSTKNAIATAINNAAAQTYQKIRANVTADGGSFGVVAAETHLAGGVGEGWTCSVTDEDCPPKHDTGAAVSSAHIAEGVATVVVPDLTAIAPARTYADILPISVRSDGVLTSTFNVSGGAAMVAALSDASTRHLYVAKEGLTIGANGSLILPFPTIMAAVAKAETLIPPPSGADPVLIDIGPGVFAESVVVRCDGLIFKGSNYLATIIEPVDGPCFCATNATLESLADFHVSGTFSDLHPQVPYTDGPKTLVLQHIMLRSALAAGNHRCLELLGVKDPGTGTTGFLDKFSMQYCQLQGTVMPGVAAYTYARNANYIELIDTFSGGGGGAGGDNFYNIGMTFLYDASLAAYFSYITGDPDGEPTWGNLGHYIYSTSSADWRFEDETLAYFYDCDLDNLNVVDTAYVYGLRSSFGHQTVSNTGELEYDGCYFREELTIGATATVTLRDCHVEGTTAITGGAGVVTEIDCTFKGLITDATNKLVHGGMDRYGVYPEAAGAGDRPISFSPAFPATATIVVTLMFESTGGVYATGMIKNGTLANTGFTLTTGGNGKFHWHAHRTK